MLLSRPWLSSYTQRNTMAIAIVDVITGRKNTVRKKPESLMPRFSRRASPSEAMAPKGTTPRVKMKVLRSETQNSGFWSMAA